MSRTEDKRKNADIHPLNPDPKSEGREMLISPDDPREITTGPPHHFAAAAGEREPETEESPGYNDIPLNSIEEGARPNYLNRQADEEAQAQPEVSLQSERTFELPVFSTLDNTHLVTYILFVLSMIWSISFGPMFDNYLLDIGGSNYFVGVVESIRGMTGLCTALPLGYLGDTYSRRRVIQCFLAVTASAFACFGIGVMYDNVYCICVGISGIAFSMQSYQSNLQALIADSVPSTAQRTRAVSFATTAGVLGSGALDCDALVTFG